MEPEERDGELAVLEMALAEELGGEVPPDVWPRLQRAHTGSMRAPARSRSQPWLVAALLTIGVTVVGVLATLDRTTPPATPPLDQRQLETTAEGPHTLEQAQARLVGMEHATVEARAVQSAVSSAWYALDQHPLEDFLGRKPNPRDLGDLTRGDLIDVLIDSLRAATALPTPRAGVVWTHSIQMPAARGGTLGGLELLVADAKNGAPLLAFAGANGPLAFAAPAFPRPQLAPIFAEATQLKIAARGFVLGDTGFAAVPTTATRLRLCEVSSAGISAIARFPTCHQLDLLASPACHPGAVLRPLAGRSLRDLVACASWLDAEGFAAIAACATLKELFLVGPEGAMTSFLEVRRVTAAPQLDDAAVAVLARLTGLTELALCGGSFGDRGLAALAPMTKLRRLTLLRCERITPAGWQAFAGHGLLQLDVRGCAPPTATSNPLAALPALQTLHIGSPSAPLRLAALTALPALTELVIDGAIDAAELAGVQHLPALRALGLRLVPPLGDGDLRLLHGASQLRRLKLSNERLSSAGLAALRAALPKCTIGDELW